MYFNRTLLFSIALCVATAFASSVPLEARAGRCVGQGRACIVDKQCCAGLSCNKLSVENNLNGKQQYAVSDASAS